MNIPLNIDWQQILLHLFNFAILAGGLYLLLYKPVKDFMDKRMEYYQNMETNAKTKLEQAEQMEQSCQERLNGLETEISEKRSKAFAETEKANANRIHDAQKQAEKILSDARENAEREHEKMLDNAQKEIADMVTLATEKLVLQSSASEAFDQFLNAAERGAENE